MPMTGREERALRQIEARFRHVSIRPSEALPSRLYHYTSAAGLLGIVSQGILRGTHFGHLKDSTEIQYGLGIARDLTRRCAGRTGIVPAGVSCSGLIKISKPRAGQPTSILRVSANNPIFSASGGPTVRRTGASASALTLRIWAPNLPESCTHSSISTRSCHERAIAHLRPRLRGRVLGSLSVLRQSWSKGSRFPPLGSFVVVGECSSVVLLESALTSEVHPA